MSKILILNTGGTFNKRYNPLRGELEVPNDSFALESILCYCYNSAYEIQNIIHKDSLDMNDDDRALIAQCINNSTHDKIIIVHGTDTMDITASYLASHVTYKTVILTGAMVPFSINTVEATSNFMLALSDLQSREKRGIFIAMHGLVAPYNAIYKNRTKGIFEPCENSQDS
ncbi:MAG: asparaginase domain-containing protein [Sulfurospirillaceae bacterium]|nr:asparaginase domain-containing protein [Sulfurospirillaceae bacterium]